MKLSAYAPDELVQRAGSHYHKHLKRVKQDPNYGISELVQVGLETLARADSQTLTQARASLKNKESPDAPVVPGLTVGKSPPKG